MMEELKQNSAIMGTQHETCPKREKCYLLIKFTIRAQKEKNLMISKSVCPNLMHLSSFISELTQTLQAKQL